MVNYIFTLGLIINSGSLVLIYPKQVRKLLGYISGCYTTPIAGQTGPRVLKGKGPGPGCPTNVGPTLHPDISRGLSPDISRPMDARPTFRPGAWGLHGPDGLTLTFPSGNFPKLSCPPDFYLTSESSFMN